MRVSFLPNSEKVFTRYNFVLVSIFLLALTLRMIATTVPINVDETFWRFRSRDFLISFITGDFENTYLRHHPGVTNMWMIGAARATNLVLDKFMSWMGTNQELICFETSVCPLSEWVIMRTVQALITSAGIVGIFILTKRLLGQSVALVAVCLLLLEPFFLAYQRFITTDALQTIFTTLAVLMLLIHLQQQKDHRWLLGSGVSMGLAIASKIPALFVLPALVIWILLTETGVWQSNFQRRGWLQQSANMTLWGITLGATIFVIWPAMWVAPVSTFQQLVQDLMDESVRGHFFFLGQNTDAPGLLFYPLVLLFRLTSVLQFGILLFLVFILYSKPLPVQLNKSTLIAIGLVPAVVLFIFSIIDSKFDRYIHLIFPELAILAAVGWYIGAIYLRAWTKRFLHRADYEDNRLAFRGLFITIAILASFQVVSLARHYPYYINYYNPVVGGSQIAQHIFQIGQGEGLDQAANWLNQESNNKDLIVGSWYNSVFSVYYEDETLPILMVPRTLRNKVDLLRTHRIVLYINQQQRQLPAPEFTDYFAIQEPLHTVKISGLDYVQIYPGLSPIAEDLENIQVPISSTINSDVQLIGFNQSSSSVKSNDELILTFYWKFLKKPTQNRRLNIGIIDTEGQILITETTTGLLNGFIPLTGVDGGAVIRDVRKVLIDDSLKPGKYHIIVGWDDLSGDVISLPVHTLPKKFVESKK